MHRPTVTIIDPSTHQGHLPKCRDNNNVLWNSSKWYGLEKSVDFGNTWTQVLSAPHDTTIEPTALLVADSGRAIWCSNDGKVYVSDAGKTSWTLAITLTAGYVSYLYGYHQYKDIILLSSYGDQTTTNSPRFVYGSFDGGATFSKLYEGDQKIGYHIHDVAYDHYNDRIIISEGDVSKRQIKFSDDHGLTWKQVWSVDGIGIQPTQIVICKDGVLFGSDQPPDGFAFWKRTKTYLQEPIEWYAIGKAAYMLSGGEIMNEMFQKSYTHHGVKPYYMFGTNPVTAKGYSRILFSYDCKEFYELWKDSTPQNYGVQWVLGAAENDPNKRFYAVLYKNNNQYLLKGQLN